MTQRGGALTPGEVHQNCSVEDGLHNDTDALVLRFFYLAVVDVATGGRNATQAAVEGQDVR